MPLRSYPLAATAALALIALVGATYSGVLAQDATPVAEAPIPRPVHIHAGNCEDPGDIVAALTDLTAASGTQVGQAERATRVESSFTPNVPLTLDAILGADHAIDVHLSAEAIETSIACGEIGGTLNDDGALVVGLREQTISGYTGIGYLQPAADGASTDVSVFIAQVQAAG